jgi:hypothetical protein
VPLRLDYPGLVTLSGVPSARAAQSKKEKSNSSLAPAHHLDDATGPQPILLSPTPASPDSPPPILAQYLITASQASDLASPQYGSSPVLVAMAPLDKVPGDLKLYIGGYVF